MPEAHFQLLLALSEHLEKSGLVLYEHHYRYIAFGAFMIQLGTSHNRLQFEWDGKERWLVCSSAKLSRQGEHPVWSKVDERAVPNEQEPLSAIQAAVNERFAI